MKCAVPHNDNLLVYVKFMSLWSRVCTECCTFVSVARCDLFQL